MEKKTERGIVYLVTAATAGLFEVSYKSFKENIKKETPVFVITEVEIKAEGAKVIRVPAGRADIFGVPSHVKGFDKLMVVRPTVFWGSDPLKAFGLSRPGAVVSGVRHPLLCTGEFKDYVKNHLFEKCENFISSELVVIDVDGFKAKRLAEKYNAFPADEKKAFADPEEDLLNILAGTGCGIMPECVLAVPGKSVLYPVAVSYRYSGRPWEHPVAEYADIYERYASDSAPEIKLQSLKSICENYKNKMKVASSVMGLAYAM